ncbi:MAG TPA: alanine racemase [Propionibacteriaceae bacterium]|nr:alanine racemase [Propionibacteriaceae bacterium]
MSVTLHLRTAAWREHLASVVASTPGIVPVAKGNGYGFGLGCLASETALLSAQNVDTMAVGMASEVAAVRNGGWTGDVVVLTPWSASDPVATALLADDRVITTVGRMDDLARLARDHTGTRVVVERLTSMKRFGLEQADLAVVGRLLKDVCFEGWTIHLPMVSDPREVRVLASSCLDAASAPLWLSHVPAADYASLRDEFSVPTRLRIGTRLWLGAPATRRTTARVLDVHPVRRGEKVGYWQRRVRSDGWVVVLAGGTAHGIALEAPTTAASLRQRAVSVATGSMEALGLALSPFELAGKKRLFIEPPHMQHSMVFLPGAASVAIGDEVPVELRLTTATVDRIVDEP